MNLRYAVPFIVGQLLLVSCSGVTMNQLTGQGLKPLKATAIKERFSNLALHFEAIDFDAEVQFSANGTLQAKSISGESEKGKWAVNEKDQLCLKFSRWYYSDLLCYQIVETSEHELLFFTANGARQYSATIRSGKTQPDTAATRSVHSKGTQLKGSTDGGKSAAISREETQRSLIRLAHNCPDCQLSGQDFTGAELANANLSDSNLAGADFTEANLRRANLQRADLRGAKLLRANLAGADLRGAQLSGADLSGSNLISADVTDADLSGASLEDTHIESIKGLNRP